MRDILYFEGFDWLFAVVKIEVIESLSLYLGLIISLLMHVLQFIMKVWLGGNWSCFYTATEDYIPGGAEVAFIIFLYKICVKLQAKNEHFNLRAKNTAWNWKSWVCLHELSNHIAFSEEFEYLSICHIKIHVAFISWHFHLFLMRVGNYISISSYLLLPSHINISKATQELK